MVRPTRKWYSDLEGKEIQTRATTRVNLEGMRLSEINQPQKEKHCVLSLTGAVRITGSRTVVAGGGGGGGVTGSEFVPTVCFARRRRMVLVVTQRCEWILIPLNCALKNDLRW